MIGPICDTMNSTVTVTWIEQVKKAWVGRIPEPELIKKSVNNPFKQFSQRVQMPVSGEARQKTGTNHCIQQIISTKTRPTVQRNEVIDKLGKRHSD